jgi:hypothetical protein
MLCGSSFFLPCQPSPRIAQAFFISKFRFMLDMLRRLRRCFEKQALQYTGFPFVGSKGTVAISPQSVHLTSNILFWDT